MKRRDKKIYVEEKARGGDEGGGNTSGGSRKKRYIQGEGVLERKEEAEYHKTDS